MKYENMSMENMRVEVDENRVRAVNKLLEAASWIPEKDIYALCEFIRKCPDCDKYYVGPKNQKRCKKCAKLHSVRKVNEQYKSIHYQHDSYVSTGRMKLVEKFSKRGK